MTKKRGSCICGHEQGGMGNLGILRTGLNDAEAIRVAEDPYLSMYCQGFSPLNGRPYFLIVTRDHELSFDRIPEPHRVGMGKMVAHFRERSNGVLPIIFEHGETPRNESEAGAKSVFHAHTHVVFTDKPVLRKLGGILREKGVSFQKVRFRGEDLIRDLPKEARRKGYYVLRQGDYGFYVVKGSGSEVPSQFLVRCLAEVLEPNYPYPDWKNLRREDGELFARRLMAQVDFINQMR